MKIWRYRDSISRFNQSRPSRSWWSCTILFALIFFLPLAFGEDPFVEQEKSAYAKGDFDGMIATATQAIQNDPKNGVAYYMRAAAYAKKGDSDKAVADYNEAVQFPPIRAASYYALAEIFLTKSDYKNALIDCSQAILYQPQLVPVYITRGRIYRFQGENDKAIDDFTRAIAMEEKVGPILAARGMANWKTVLSEKADTEFDMVADLDHEKATAYRNRAAVYYDQRDYDHAIADCTESIRIDAQNPGAYRTRAGAYDGRGVEHYQKGDFEAALADLNQVILLDPKDPRGYAMLAVLRMSCPQQNLVDTKLAIQNATKACEASGWVAPLMIETLASAYASTRDYDSAIKWQKYCLGLPNLTAKGREQVQRRLGLYESILRPWSSTSEKGSGTNTITQPNWPTIDLYHPPSRSRP